MEITCGNCGKKSPFYLWLESPTGDRLPDNHYRCPECKTTIRRVSGPPRVIDMGRDKTMIIPGDITIEQIPSRL